MRSTLAAERTEAPPLLSSGVTQVASYGDASNRRLSGRNSADLHRVLVA